MSQLKGKGGKLKQQALKEQSEDKGTDDLVEEAVAIHQDTTNKARQALAIVEATKAVGADTLLMLHAQGEQIDRVNADLDKINADLDYAGKMLNYMSRCFLCAVCMKDPEAERNDALKKKGKGPPPKPGELGSLVDKYGRPKSQAQIEAEKARMLKMPKEEMGNRLGGKYAAQQKMLDKETDEQNEIFDAIGNGLDDMLNQGVGMGEELDRQKGKLSQMEDGMDNATNKLKNTNKKLDEMVDGKPSKGKNKSVGGAKVAMARAAAGV